MSELTVPQFDASEDEATFWDSLNTAESMDDDGEWFTFEALGKRAARVAILPKVPSELAQPRPGGTQRARAQGE